MPDIRYISTCLNHSSDSQELKENCMHVCWMKYGQFGWSSLPMFSIYVPEIHRCTAPLSLWEWYKVASLLCDPCTGHAGHISYCDMHRRRQENGQKNKQMASSGLCNPFLPSAIISSTVTWCRPTVKARPMKLPPAWLDPELLPPPPEPGPELTNSRRESKNFLIVSKWQGYLRLQMSCRSLYAQLLQWYR